MNGFGHLDVFGLCVLSTFQSGNKPAALPGVFNRCAAKDTACCHCNPSPDFAYNGAGILAGYAHPPDKSTGKW